MGLERTLLFHLSHLQGTESVSSGLGHSFSCRGKCSANGVCPKAQSQSWWRSDLHFCLFQPQTCVSSPMTPTQQRRSRALGKAACRHPQAPARLCNSPSAPPDRREWRLYSRERGASPGCGICGLTKPGSTQLVTWPSYLTFLSHAAGMGTRGYG